ncbi:MAG TPA: hypothetical protein VGI28_05625 [Stellaceae bacterium]|jgi:hypothetical protein
MKLTIQQAQGGYVLTLEKPARGREPEYSVCHTGADMFAQLINCVPGMAEVAWDWAMAELERRMAAEKTQHADSLNG